MVMIWSSSVFDIVLNIGKFARRLVDVEVAVDWDFVANFGLQKINPGIGPMRLHLSGKVRFAVSTDEAINLVLSESLS